MDEIFVRVTRDLGNGSLLLFIACILLYKALAKCQADYIEQLRADREENEKTERPKE